MEPKTILYMTPSARLLGARQSLLALVCNLDPERYRAVVCSQSEGQLTEALRDCGVKVEILHSGWWRKARYWPRVPYALWRLTQIARREKAAIIHCNEIYPNPYAVTAARWLKVPVVTHMRLSVTEEMTRKYYLHSAEQIVVVSNAAGRDFDHWPDKGRKVITIYNGVDINQYTDGISREQARRNLDFSENDFVIGMIATWAHRKRQHVAVEALSLLAEKVPEAKLLVVGGAARSQADYEAELRALIESLGLQNRIRMIPFQQDLAPIYHAIDVNLLISGDEGFGRTIIESGSVGIPTVGAMAGGIPEVIRANVTGWLVPVDDRKQLAERLEYLANNRAALQQAGEQARDHVRREFSIEKHTQKMQALYDRVLSDYQRRHKRP